MNPNAAQQCANGALQHRLCIAVLAYQRALAEYRESTDTMRKAALLDLQQQLLEQIYADLHDPLFSLVKGWGRSLLMQEQRSTSANANDALESITMSVFGDVAFALQTCKLDANRDVCNFLIQIARNKLHDQEYRIYNNRLHLTQRDENYQSSMWPAPQSWVGGVWGTESSAEDQSYLAEPEDPASIDFDNQLIRHRDDETFLRSVLQFWKTGLSGRDFLIVKLRWTVDPPLSFLAIAQRLGEGWSAAAVRQRHHRILRRTYDHLIQQGLIEPGEIR